MTALGHVNLYAYDKAARMTSRIDPNGTVFSYTYTPNGLIEEINALNTALGLNHTTQNTWDPDGNLISAIDGSVLTAYNKEGGSYSPDAYGRIRGIETVLGGKSLSTSYSYDTMHRMTKMVYGSGEETNYLYNNLGQLEGLPGILSGYISYNTAGLMAGYTYANNVDTEFSYDRSKRLTRKEYFGPAGETLSLLSLSYDATDNIIGKNGGTYRYDANNMLTEADERGAFAVNVAQKKAAGEYQDMMAAEGDYTGSLSMTFQAGELELSLDYGSISIGADLGDYHYVGSIEINPRETNWRVTPRQIEVYLSARNDENYYTQIKDYLYLEEEGKIILRMRKPEGARYVKVHCTFDDRDSHNNYVNDLSTIANEARELITVNYLTRERLEEYSYDAKGNRTQRLTNHDGRIGTNLYTYYPNSDRIKSDGTYAYRYDANGNRTGKGAHYTDNGADIEYSALEGEVWTYRYDPFNRLAEVRKSYEGTENLELAASYSYDHRSLRVQRTDREGISTYYAYSPQGRLLYEEREGEITDYIYLGNKLAAKRTAGRTLWYSTDHLGSTVMLTDEAGEIVWSEGYTAFGEASGKTGYEISESGRYTGKDYDEATGLYYYNARWYDASLGRFLTEDPARDGANWYVYVRNNPLRYVDPTGLRIIKDNDETGRPVTETGKEVGERHRRNREERIEKTKNETMRMGEARRYENSLKIGFQWPLKNISQGDITSPFGTRDDAEPRKHDGIDIRAKAGTPVYASDEGEVSIADLEYSGSAGKHSYLIIEGTNGYQQRYVHMDSFVVKAGQAVAQGDLLGYTGTRKDTQPHLHFEIRKDGKAVDPEKYLPELPSECE